MAKFVVSVAASVGAALLTAGAFVILLMMIVGPLVAGGHPRWADSLNHNFRLVAGWDHARTVERLKTVRDGHYIDQKPA